MRIIGVTGGIGSGKTSVCSILEELGYPVYYADSAAKELMQSDQGLINSIISEFGDLIYINGKLQRQALASIVFNDSEKLEKLNALVHPIVAKDFNTWCKNQTSQVVFKEAAILFETGGYKNVDETVLVFAPERNRIDRVMTRDGVTENEVLSRMKKQWTDEQKKPLAEYIIDNYDGHLLIPQIVELIKLWNG